MTETMTCDECFGRYKPETCPKCNGTGITTTGKFLGTLPSTPDPVTDEPHEPTITTTQGDAPSVVTGNGLRYVYAPGHDSGATVNATGHDGCERGLERANATIAEQAAEIERLRGELNERGEALTMAEMSLMETDEEVKGLRADRDNWKKLFTDHLAVESQLRAKLAEATLIDAPELRTERAALRLENQRLKDASFEAQDRYAALEAERDALKETRDELRERLDRREKQLDYASIDRPLLRAELELAERQRDEAVSHCEIMAAEVRRLTEERDEAELLAWKSGMRAVPPADDMCPDCNGHGTIFSPTKPLPDLCYLCSGTGKVAPSTLKAAGGSERDALKKRISDLEGKHGWQWYEQKLDEANARAESYLAERDELKGKLDVQQEFIDDYRKTIDRLRTEVERLKGERDSVKHNFASLVAATEQGVDRIRAEKYLAVIEAGDHERLAIIAMHNAAMRAQGARSIAGLPTYVHEPSQEATCDERS